MYKSRTSLSLVCYLPFSFIFLFVFVSVTMLSRNLQTFGSSVICTVFLPSIPNLYPPAVSLFRFPHSYLISTFVEDIMQLKSYIIFLLFFTESLLLGPIYKVIQTIYCLVRLWITEFFTNTVNLTRLDQTKSTREISVDHEVDPNLPGCIYRLPSELPSSLLSYWTGTQRMVGSLIEFEKMYYP